jgi:hypothetical protein
VAQKVGTMYVSSATMVLKLGLSAQRNGTIIDIDILFDDKQSACITDTVMAMAPVGLGKI